MKQKLQLMKIPKFYNKIMVTIIVAAAKNNAIGKDNDLLWHLPIDFKRFKKLTTGHHIIMGRKTFESLPGMLPNRTHVIITRQKDYTQKNCVIVHSLAEAIKYCHTDDQPFIIGGGEIYKQGMEIADCLEITRVHESFKNADTYFPEIDLNQWELVNEECHQKDEKHKFDFSFQTFKRKDR